MPMPDGRKEHRGQSVGRAARIEALISYANRIRGPPSAASVGAGPRGSQEQIIKSSGVLPADCYTQPFVTITPHRFITTGVF